MTDTISEIRSNKAAAQERYGSEVTLSVVQSAGDVWLYPAADSDNEDAIDRWHLTREQEDALLSTDLVDEII